MTDFLETLYRQHTYPAMSHPTADPAVTAVTARLAGFSSIDPSQARILEIGCGTGHHLLSLATRWPASQCTGVDFSPLAIHQAQELAKAADIENAEFHAGSLLDFEAIDGPYDFIIAHGFFSWVPNDVKAGLLAFCGRHLSDHGIAVISFNVAAGWRQRMSIIVKARAIQEAGSVDPVTALDVLKTVTTDEAELAIIDDMIAKGQGILPFDDFAPVNDPWPLDHFAKTAAGSGLRWLGESIPALNQPEPWTAEDETSIQHLKSSPLAYHHAADEITRRTFRSALFCRTATGMAAGISSADLFQFAVRQVKECASADGEVLHALWRREPSAIHMHELARILPDISPPDLARRVMQGVNAGWLQLRTEAMDVSAVVPDYPRLNPWRMECASRSLPLVDAWLRPCSFPPNHYALLEKIDGTHSVEQLAVEARRTCPELDFQPWIHHLARRGIFS